MNCKICGTDNPEDAVFCKACGKRLSDTAVCPECSASIPSDSVFCPYCGAKQGKPEMHERTAAPVTVNAGTQKVSAAAVKPKKQILKTILKYAAPSAALMTALFALIFVFFTGYVKTGVVSTGSSVIGNKTGVNLYFYFNDAYKTLNEAFNALDALNTPYSDYFATASYLPAVLGTIISALTLATVCVLAIIAIAQGIRCLLGKTQKTGGGFAIAAFLAYLAGALALYAIDNCFIRTVESISSTQTQIMTSGCRLNGATVAGIALCAVFASHYLAIDVAKRGREMLTANSIAKWILSAVGIVVIIVTIIICARPAFILDSDDNVLREKVHVGGMYLIALLTVFCRDWYESEAVLNLNEFTAYTVISFVMLVVTIVFATRLLDGFLKKITGKPSSRQVVVSALLVASSALFMAFTIAAGKEFIKAMEYLEPILEFDSGPDNSYIVYSIPVSAFVLSAVAAAVSVAQFCVSRKKRVEPVAEAEAVDC